MERRDPTRGLAVRVGADLDEEADEGPLPRRVPVRRAWDTDRGGVQRFGAPPVLGPNVGATFDQASGNVRVVGERRAVERGVTLVDLGVTLGDEELVASYEAGHRQGRRGVEQF